ncbi:malate dehydrogenase (oxaloacetate-decarboxylating)(NADP+) [Mesocricetibacter intestinalis]|uniref:NADP-dependent malic enzyme n=1 Tax=Mesocricetibacter intestinalis TaxID=1521930 RepID=A0A4R6VL67_9PAST|nr:NADP-dependent malic enzyme [Mesocricetibacter intestinalis]TDQ59550.1 malate dehydrogenase (oxaloacetate-decarboxylating)(NADP+) [Mesocricetibacter intestinalis]
MDDQLRQAALDFHQFPVPGKIEVTPTKSLATQRDLALAYSPGVAVPCLEIQSDPAASYKYTSRGNLVAVISNGTAVLGLGNIGALAGKPVMEGKGVLFKKFAGVNVFDIEIDEKDPDKLVDIIAALEPTFGGINLEDIKAPECFYIERKLRERMNIPVFHDDQHGTAIISAAAVLNGLRIVNKKIEKVRLVASGAGAASIACLNLLISLGMKRENITVCDSKGVIYKGRDERMDETKKSYAIDDNGSRTLADVIPDADIFLGCSAAGALTQEMVKSMGPNPLILALANPDPEITPPEAKAVRPDAIVCTGRSDYPNQVNNVLCFPFIFRGALDVSATTINEEMKMAAVHAIADLALAEQSEVVSSAYGDSEVSFGPDYVIPKPFDPRLIVRIAPAVAKAAMDSGVATRPIQDFDAYIEQLTQFVYKTNLFMKPVFAQAKQQKKRVILTDGEENRVLHAVQEIATLGIASPVLIGRPGVIEQRIKKLGLHIQAGRDFEVVNPENDERYYECWSAYYELLKRRGVTPAIAKRKMLHNPTAIGAILLHLGYGDAMICGLVGSFSSHLGTIKDVIGVKEGVTVPATVNGLVLPTGNLFIADTFVNQDPNAQELAEITLMAAQEVRRFGIEPQVALVSHSNYGAYDHPSAVKMREVLQIVRNKAPELIIDGEMHCDVALSPTSRQEIMPDSPLKGAANLLVMPNMEAARISLNLLQGTTTPITVGPILMGMNKPAHILTSVSSVRRIINMVAIVAAKAQQN